MHANLVPNLLNYFVLHPRDSQNTRAVQKQFQHTRWIKFIFAPWVSK